MIKYQGVEYATYDRLLKEWGLSRYRKAFNNLLQHHTLEEVMRIINSRANIRESGKLTYTGGVWVCACGRNTGQTARSYGIDHRSCGQCAPRPRRMAQDLTGLSSEERKAWANYIRSKKDANITPQQFIDRIGHQPTPDHKYKYGQWRK